MKPLSAFFASASLFALELHVAASMQPMFGASPTVWLATVAVFQTVLLVAYAIVAPARVWRFYPLVLMLTLVPLALGGLHLRGDTPFSSNAFFAIMAGHWPILLASFGLASVFPGLVFSEERPAAWQGLFVASNLGAAVGLLSFGFVLGGLDGTTRGKILFVGASLGLVMHALARLLTKDTCSAIIGPRMSQRTWGVAAAAAASSFWYLTAHQRGEAALPATPELWALSLLAFLLSYVTAFALPRPSPRTCLIVAMLGALAVCGAELVDKMTSVSLALLGMFLGCHACHVRIRLCLEAGHATPYETALVSAIGGALAGFFASAAAPVLLSTEQQAVLAAAVLSAAVGIGAGSGVGRLRVGVTVTCTLAIAAAMWSSNQTRPGRRIDRFRGLHGEYELRLIQGESELQRRKVLYHQGTVHGAQYAHRQVSSLPVTYFSHFTGVGLALQSLRTSRGTSGGLRIGVVGLGAGTIAAYGTSGDTLRFFELDPLVTRLVSSPTTLSAFTYTGDSAAEIEIVTGDGRMLLRDERERDEPRYDALVIDAFSGGSIPTHLLTRQAFELYRDRIQPDGVIAVHTSNHILDLRPVVYDAAHQLPARAVFVRNRPRVALTPRDEACHASMLSDWILISRSETFWTSFSAKCAPLMESDTIILQDSRSVRFPGIRPCNDSACLSWWFLQPLVGRKLISQAVPQTAPRRQTAAASEEETNPFVPATG